MFNILTSDAMRKKIYYTFLFQLGEHYLILAEDKDKELNNRLAVDWLIKAAKQGRKGAARLLQRCWIQEKGFRIWCRLRHVCVFVFVIYICLFLLCL